MKILKLFLLSFIASLSLTACDIFPVDDDNHGSDIAQIDLLVLYTQAALDSFADITTQIDAVIFGANQQFANSNIKLNLSVVATSFYDVPQKITDNVNQELEFDLIFDKSTQRLRKEVTADLVVLLTVGSEESCGIAPLGIGTPEGGLLGFNYHLGYSVVGIECTNGALAHEIGHNLGLHHAPDVPGSGPGGVYPYGRGYTYTNEFTTIMGYEQNVAIRYLRFSDPTALCEDSGGNEHPCGEAEGSRIDAVSALNQKVIFQVANYSNLNN